MTKSVLALCLLALTACTSPGSPAVVQGDRPSTTALAIPEAAAVILSSYRDCDALGCVTTIDRAREQYFENCINASIKTVLPNVKLVRMPVIRTALAKQKPADLPTSKDLLMRRFQQDHGLTANQLHLRYLIFLDVSVTPNGMTTSESHGGTLLPIPIGNLNSVGRYPVVGRVEAAVMDLADGNQVATLFASSDGEIVSRFGFTLIVPWGWVTSPDVKGSACKELGAAIARLWMSDSLSAR
jgi:hypothetical protein